MSVGWRLQSSQCDGGVSLQVDPELLLGVCCPAFPSDSSPPCDIPLALCLQVVTAYVADEARDPGYWGTARMVLEAGLCLALDAQATADAGCHSGGVLTPASAMGLVLMERLRRAGLMFDITDSPALDKQQQQQPAAAKEAAAVSR